ncbi:magnesium transport protein CorA [Acidocella aquatica]|uniref:Magnesium transport protein CorA n=1 Tax=Acidocella aquatica TaxID=1922313 RepID=A0ABQ6A1B1_9PROT|nr:magnesium transporter CorA family protein [Acidocella aquatica]GLR66234.1 magnesium transport protein CorA [Acidocella aquatica]
MLKAYACAPGGRLTSLALAQMPQALWFDLENPAPEDYAFVTRETGLALPQQDNILEIENSSRLSANGDVLTLTMPIVTRTPEGLQSSACGFVLAPDRLVTIRFTPGQVFTQFATQPLETGVSGASNAAFIFTGLLEAIVDRQADALENLRRELDDLSHQIFHHRLSAKPQERAARRRNAEAELQATLAVLGRGYDTISFLRDSQLGIARIAPYVLGTAAWLPEAARQRLQSVEKDIASLNEFSTHLSDKVQFLLDATLGLINVAQNSLIKVLTIVSIVGIPPTLIAGIYGMNFHDIPEITWRYGYVYAWGVMILSSMLPLAWFRKKGWL